MLKKELSLFVRLEKADPAPAAPPRTPGSVCACIADETNISGAARVRIVSARLLRHFVTFVTLFTTMQNPSNQLVRSLAFATIGRVEEGEITSGWFRLGGDCDKIRVLPTRLVSFTDSK